MPFLNDKGDAVKGLAIGVGVAMAAPVVLASLFGASRPLARAAIKTGLIVYEKGRETLAEVSEVVEDLAAEARAEVAEEHMRQAGAAGAEAGEEGTRSPASGNGKSS